MDPATDSHRFFWGGSDFLGGAGFCASTIPMLRSANIIDETTFQGKHDLDTLNVHEALRIS